MQNWSENDCFDTDVLHSLWVFFCTLLLPGSNWHSAKKQMFIINNLKYLLHIYNCPKCYVRKKMWRKATPIEPNQLKAHQLELRVRHLKTIKYFIFIAFENKIENIYNVKTHRIYKKRGFSCNSYYSYLKKLTMKVFIEMSSSTFSFSEFWSPNLFMNTKRDYFCI